MSWRAWCLILAFAFAAVVGIATAAFWPLDPAAEAGRMRQAMSSLSGAHMRGSFHLREGEGSSLHVERLFVDADVRLLSGSGFVADVSHVQSAPTSMYSQQQFVEAAGVRYRRFDPKEGWRVQERTNEAVSLDGLWAFSPSLFLDVPWEDGVPGEVRTALASADIFAVTDAGTRWQIPGEQGRVIEARLVPDTARSWLVGFLTQMNGSVSDADRLLIERTVGLWSPLTWRWYIGSKTHRLYRIEVDGEVPVLGRASARSFSGRVDFSSFNEVKPIPVPTPVVRIGADGALTGIPATRTQKHSPAAGSLGAASIDDPDDDGLSNTQEVFYGTNPLVADTDADGVGDGDEVDAGTNPTGEGRLFGFGVLHR
ncbi:hypothetical protein HYV73_04405 [Candidatus Uhrbacteria bacterium]|nr:hypothetical protein [Candidatus Uhrbacteria bacterium]